LPENTLPSTAKLEALFYGLGSDGSVSATKNNIKIIGNSTPWYARVTSSMTPKSRWPDRFPPARQRTPIRSRIWFLRLILLAATSCSLSINTRWPSA
jgi:pyruvate-ferredoxin/flavodoxin oxidoreductase